MAIIYKATLSPTKLELLEKYLPRLAGLASRGPDALTQIGAYRFDDPAGAVGIETIILTTGTGTLIQRPLTYRNDPLEDAEDWFVGTTEHSVLGTRWVYAGFGDPVYVGQLVRTIASGGSGAEEEVQSSDGPVNRQPTVTVAGSTSGDLATWRLDDLTPSIVGTDIHIGIGDHTLGINLALRPGELATGSHHLTGTWATSPDPTVLATIW